MPQLNEGASRLKEIMAENAWSQRQLARELGVFEGGVVTHWLKGRRRPSLESAMKIEARLGIPLSAWKKPLRTKRRRASASN